MKKTVLMLVTAFLFLSGLLFAQSEKRFSINALPYGTVPLGSSADSFNFGGGTELSGVFIPASFKSLGASAGTIISTIPLESKQSSIWSTAMFAGPFYRFSLSDRLSLFAAGRTGYYYWGPVGWEADGENGGGLFLGGGGGALFRLSGPATLGAELSYDYYSDLYNGLGIKLAVSLDFPALKTESNAIEVRSIKLHPLFPVLFSYYGGHSVGTAVIYNKGKKTVEDVQVNFFVERYMDNPMEAKARVTLEPGQEKSVELYALFTEDVMEITEGTKASARISTHYRGKKADFSQKKSAVLEFYNRNAMMWDDDEKIASFITAKDPEIMNFAKNVGSWMQKVQNPAVDGNLQRGIAVFEAVKAHGVRYEIDPTTPFSEYSEKTSAIDFIQFPRQTMQYSNGDCDDLTALYTSLLEALGVETAFITVPGHIYAAFALETRPEEVEKIFTRPQDLITLDEKVWLPVEITLFQEGFEKAWQTGAKEWREHIEKEQAVLFPTREAWATYQAVGFNEGGSQIPLPDQGVLSAAIESSISRHVEKEIYPQIEKLERRIAQSRGNVKYRNSLAVVYARYGMYGKAIEGFLDILRRQDYLPAMTNAANIYFLQENYGAALDMYNRVLEQDGENRAALLGVARCNHELENYGFVRQAYEKIQKIDPELAERYAYLDMKGEDAARASDAAGLKHTVLWEDEE